MLTSAPILKRTSVTPTPSVPTPLGLISVDVWRDMKAMEESAQVYIQLDFQILALDPFYSCNQFILCLYLQPWYLVARHLVVQMGFAKTKMDSQYVLVFLVSKATDTIALVIKTQFFTPLVINPASAPVDLLNWKKKIKKA